MEKLELQQSEQQVSLRRLASKSFPQANARTYEKELDKMVVVRATGCHSLQG